MGSARYEKFLMYPSKGKVGWKNGQKFILKATKKGRTHTRTTQRDDSLLVSSIPQSVSFCLKI
jgi:hypothetical protein